MDIWHLTNKEKRIGLKMEGKVAIAIHFLRSIPKLRKNRKHQIGPKCTQLCRRQLIENILDTFMYCTLASNFQRDSLNTSKTQQIENITLFSPPLPSPSSPTTHSHPSEYKGRCPRFFPHLLNREKKD